MAGAVAAVPEPVNVGNAISVTSPLFVVLVLMFIVALIFGLAWFVKHLGGASLMTGRGMKIVASLPVGVREKVLLIDVAGTQMLIGVAPGRVSQLHLFEDPVIDLENNSGGDFAKKMKFFLQQQTNKSDKNTGDIS